MEIKNCLFTGVQKTGRYSVDRVRFIIEQAEIKSAYAVIDGNNHLSGFKQCFNFWEIINGNYDLYMRVPPVDRDFKNLISEYTEEIFHMMDRCGRTFTEKKVDLLYRHISFWTHFLVEKEISFVVFHFIPHEVYDYIIYRLCEKLGICFSVMTDTTFSYYTGTKGTYFIKAIEKPSTCEMLNKYHMLCQEYSNIDEVPVSQKVEDWITDVEKSAEIVDFISKKNLFKRESKEILRYGGNPIERFYDWKSSPHKMHDLGPMCRSVLSTTLAYWRERRRTKNLIRHYEKLACRPDLNNSCYIYYALHYQPEATSCPLGGIFANQIAAIRMLAYNLPSGWQIYVKEHPSQISFGREGGFYDEITKIPNVKLVSIYIPSLMLAKNSLATASLTGEITWESMILGKPSLVLGYTNVTLCSGAHQIDTNEQCRSCYEKIADGSIEITTRKELRLICNAIESLCFMENSSSEDNDEYAEKVIEYMKFCKKG